MRINLSVLAWNENVTNPNEKTYNFIDSLHFASINNMLANNEDENDIADEIEDDENIGNDNGSDRY